MVDGWLKVGVVVSSNVAWSILLLNVGVTIVIVIVEVVIVEVVIAVVIVNNFVARHLQPEICVSCAELVGSRFS